MPDKYACGLVLLYMGFVCEFDKTKIVPQQKKKSETTGKETTQVQRPLCVDVFMSECVLYVSASVAATPN